MVLDGLWWDSLKRSCNPAVLAFCLDLMNRNGSPLGAYFEFLLEPLDFIFMQWALAVTVVVAAVCAVLSCWLVLIGWSLMGDAVSHAVPPGVVLACIAGIPFAMGAV